MTKEQLEKVVGKYPCDGCPAGCIYDSYLDELFYDAQLHSDVRGSLERNPEEFIGFLPALLRRLRDNIIKAPNFASINDRFDFLVCRQLHLKENFTQLKGEEVEVSTDH
jgi:hypothetical protein